MRRGRKGRERGRRGGDGWREGGRENKGTSVNAVSTVAATTRPSQGCSGGERGEGGGSNHVQRRARESKPGDIHVWGG